jgi:hypothetical protein
VKTKPNKIKDMEKVTIIISAPKKIKERVSQAVTDGKRYQHQYARLLGARVLGVKQEIEDLPEEDQVKIMRNVLVTERNIASYAADQYALLNQSAIFDDLLQIVNELDELLKA